MKSKFISLTQMTVLVYLAIKAMSEDRTLIVEVVTSQRGKKPSGQSRLSLKVCRLFVHQALSDLSLITALSHVESLPPFSGPIQAFAPSHDLIPLGLHGGVDRYFSKLLHYFTCL